jgi:uncharacterized protein DUF5329
MRFMAIALLILLQFTIPAGAESPANEIAYLLKFIRDSPCTFIRNGTDYDGPEASDHVAAKYAHFKGEIRTVEDFIDRAATKSLLSGEPYQVKCGSGPVEAAADWLRDALRSYRVQHVTPGVE